MNIFECSLEELSKAIKTPLHEGCIVVFQTSNDRVQSLGDSIQMVNHILKKFRITALVCSDEVSMVVVPEARRAIMIPVQRQPPEDGSK